MAEVTWDGIAFKRNDSKMSWIKNKIKIMIKKLTKSNSNVSASGN